jgi:fructose-1,6-bisphosphatase
MNRKEILSEIEADMKELYRQMTKKLIDRQDADSRANIAGKRLKVVQLDLADDIFTKGALPSAGMEKLIEAN